MEPMNAMHVIQILGSDISNGTLKLSDDGVSKVRPCEWITWLTHPNSGVRDIIGINVKDITGISVEKTNPNLFKTGPCKLGSSSNWRGQILCDIGVSTYEDYDIVWEDYNGNIHTYDPRIMVNPDI